jgi:hypothetical protein
MSEELLIESLSPLERKVLPLVYLKDLDKNIMSMLLKVFGKQKK